MPLGVYLVGSQQYYQTTGTNLGMAAITGWCPNDVGIAVVCSSGTITPPAGWTAVGGMAAVTWNTTYKMQAWYRVLQTADTGGWNWTVPTGITGGCIRCYRNVNTTTPINAYATATSASGTSLLIAAPTETPGIGELYLGFWFSFVNQAVTCPAALTNVYAASALAHGDTLVNTDVAQTATVPGSSAMVGIGMTLNAGATLRIIDRTWDTTVTSGTGAVTLANSPPSGYNSFGSNLNVGDTVAYCIASRTLGTWEVGLGTYSATNTLTRTQVFDNSNAGNANAFISFGSETKDVMAVIPAEIYPLLQNALQSSATIAWTGGDNWVNLDASLFNIPSGSTAVAFTRASIMTLAGPNSLTGHAGAYLGWIDDQSSGVHSSLVVVEGRFQTDNPSTIVTQSVCLDSDVAQNLGTITTHFQVIASIFNNIGNIGTYYGFYNSGLSGGGNTGTITAGYCFANLEPTHTMINYGKHWPALGGYDISSEVTGAPHPGWGTGRYYYGINPATTAFTTVALVANTIIYAPIFVPQTVTISKIGTRVITGGAGSSVQFAIYRQYVGQLINGLVYSSASQASTTSATTVEVTGLAVTLNPGMYYLAINCSATAPSINFYTELSQGRFGNTTYNGLETKVTTASTLGTWPATPTPAYAANTTGVFPLIWLRV